ncbi:hypothetical protein Taro_010880 [Colocasia esculenta]|uniref:Uncharacterized protein n=1 Tax=Colocasia esculenta TaxID=4460 RepID=A0A843U8A6_COLES|nr:hypothetical protein [Colocasia esculenta]
MESCLPCRTHFRMHPPDPSRLHERALKTRRDLKWMPIRPGEPWKWRGSIEEEWAMARRGAQARDDEQMHEERGEQQAPPPQGPTAQATAPVPQEHGHGGPSIVERFKRMALPSFKGESQPLLAESRMREVEKIFRAIRCTEEDKISLASYML